jgi:xylulokinase
MSLLGLDVGTTGCKAAALSVEGRWLADAYREYPLLHPRPNWCELDSRLVLDMVKETIAAVAAETKADPITAMSVSTMGESMTPVSADRQVLGNAIFPTLDTRGTNYVEALSKEIGQERFYAVNPNVLGPQYSLPKLLWLRDNEPEQYGKAWKYLLWGDFIGFMLGCEPLTSFSHANRTLLFDIHKEDWSETLLSWAGIDREKLPAPVASGTIAGTVSDSVATELGLQKGVALIVGGHDQCCNSLGAGIYEAGKAVCGIGTIECITPTYDRIPGALEMLRNGLSVEHHVLPGLYVSFIYNQSGVLVRWFRDTFAQADKQLAQSTDLYDLLAAEMPDEPTKLLVLPHFEVTGTPSFIADSAGVIAGLKTSTTRGEVLKAVMEGTTFYFVESINALKALGIDTSEFIATGGGAKSDAWLQIKADIFGVPFVRPVVTECGILGAAILAGTATGVFNNVQEAVAATVKRERVFEPRLDRHEKYRDRYGQYKRLHPAMKGLLADLGEDEA